MGSARSLADIHPRFAHYAFRHACGLPPLPDTSGLLEWLATCGKNAAPVLDVDLRTEPCRVFDLGVSSILVEGDPQKLEMATLTEAIDRELLQARVQ